MGREEMFSAAQKAVEAEKERRTFSKDYEVVPYCDLEENKPKAFRIIGDTVNARTKPFHPKLIHTSKIIDDKGGQFICKWADDRNWILHEIYNKVMAGTWDKNAVNPATPGKLGMKIFTYANTYPHLFNRVRWNNKPDNSMERGWNPQALVVMNVIERDDYAWHQENKTFKIISRKVSVDKNDATRIYHEPGLTYGTYEDILRAVVEEKGDWESFDIAITKLEEKPWYVVYSAFDERKIADKLKTPMSSVPLTDEERSWKTYDLDHLYQFTAYTKILNRLGSFITEVDASFKTNFMERLTKLSDAEKAKWESEKKTDDPFSEEAPKTVEEKPARARQAPSSPAVVNTPSNSVLDIARRAGWKGLDKLSPAEVKSIKAVHLAPNPQDDRMVFVDDAGIEIPEADLLPCYECGVPAPDSIKACAKCGALFE